VNFLSFISNLSPLWDQRPSSTSLCFNLIWFWLNKLFDSLSILLFFGGGRRWTRNTHSIIYALSRMIEYHDVERWYPTKISPVHSGKKTTEGDSRCTTNRIWPSKLSEKEAAANGKHPLILSLIGFKVAKTFFCLGSKGNPQIFLKNTAKGAQGESKQELGAIKIETLRWLIPFYLQSIKSGERVDSQIIKSRVSQFKLFNKSGNVGHWREVWRVSDRFYNWLGTVFLDRDIVRWIRWSPRKK
jgi:hypothetical protein